jgi:flagellar basal-body rod protein FlgC
MSLFSTIDIAGSALAAQTVRLNVTASNMANAETTKTKAGGPYQRRTLSIASKPVADGFSDQLKSAAVKLAASKPGHIQPQRVRRFGGQQIHLAEAEEKRVIDENMRMVYDPAHPDADAEGFVAMPNIDPLGEMVEMMTAARAYEANVTAVKSVQKMVQKALDI